MEFEREFIVIGNTLQIRYYGIIIVLAMLVAAWVAARIARREGDDPDHIWGALTWAIIPAIIGARLWFVLFPPAALVEQGMDTVWFLQNFTNLQNGPLAIWSGGLGIFGAVLGGLLGAYIYLRRNNLSVGHWLDIAAVVLPLGQAIGRWANYVNQELYGTPTTLPWGITIDSAHRVDPYRSLIDYPLDTRFHPLFLYESLWNLIAFIVLLNIFQRRRNYNLRQGDIFLLYVMQYSVIRFLLEFLRVEIAWIPGTTINSSQTTTVVAFVVALVLFIIRRRNAPQPESTTAASGEKRAV
ncbi:MAG: prolipoprotein diacylglyceryl transferase [Chloroflexota bacterium]|nr:MAG: prolipoprotein diacylglyceryl transferase [Chloroflexota bacterium]